MYVYGRLCLEVQVRVCRCMFRYVNVWNMLCSGLCVGDVRFRGVCEGYIWLILGLCVCTYTWCHSEVYV